MSGIRRLVDYPWVLVRVRCAVYNGTLGSEFGHRFDRLANADPALAEAA